MSNARLIIGLLCSLLVVSVVRAESGDETILLSAGDIVVTGADFQQELLLLTKTERASVLAEPAQIQGLLRRIYFGKRMMAEAERLGLHNDPSTRARLAAERRRVLSEALREHAQQHVQLPDFAALAREHYATRQDEFRVPEQFKVAHILKKVKCDCEKDEKRRQVEQLLAQLKAGEDFATLAKTQSDDTGSAAQGGDMGRWLKREEVVAPFADAMAKLQVGQLSDVVETQYGFHVIKVLDRQPARQQSFEEVRGQLEPSLQQSYIQDQLKQQALAYLPGADAQFNEPALKALLHDSEAKKTTP